MHNALKLRVAFITGTLGQAGAEKQFLFMLRALIHAGVTVRVYTPAQTGFYQSVLQDMQLAPVWFGRYSDPIRRIAVLIKDLRQFRPDVLQSIHAFTNPYAAVAGKAVHAVSIGGLRSDLGTFLAKHPLVGRLMLEMPDALAVNSSKALWEVAHNKKLKVRRVYLLRNCVEIPQPSQAEPPVMGQPVNAAFVGRLITSKRPDVFLRALAVARRSNAELTGVIVGDGPCESEMKELAASLGLMPHAVTFLGKRSDVPQILAKTSMLVFCSENEGCPNVLLESMAAGKPVITTPVGDCPQMVSDGLTGYVVPVHNVEELANRMIHLAGSRDLREKMGRAAREHVAGSYGQLQLSEHLFALYSDVMEKVSGHGLSPNFPSATTANRESTLRSR